MYGVIRRFNVTEGNTHRVLTQIQNGYVPEVSRQRGFVSYHIIDGGDGTLVSSSVFESRDAAEEASHHAAEWVRAHIARMLRLAPVIVTGEIKAQAARPQPGTSQPAAPAPAPAPRAFVPR
jgi:hypothetical protein